MSGPVFSQSWYRVTNLRVRLQAHVNLHRHVYRGKVWYVLQDHASGQFHRFSEHAWHIIGLMDGQRTLQEIWECACRELGDEMPTQDQMIDLLSKLHRADALQADLPPDVSEVVQRSRKQRRSRTLAQLRTPLSIRIPLLDPEGFLRASAPLARLLFSGFGLSLWLAVVFSGAVLAGIHWQELSHNLTDRVLTQENLILLALLYPLVKLLHELGHAYAVKRWGGEVHEMGLMLLVFFPVPYVDASAASAFAAKHQRMLVGAAGIMVELFLSGLALLLWVNVEPGIVRALAFNVMLMAGVSTLLFNGNPLLRYDGYYVFADFIEVVNLAQRANQYLGYLVKRYAFGVQDCKSPTLSGSEAGWLAVYALAAFIYRIFIITAIVMFISGKYFVIGTLLALWAIVGVFVLPVGKLLTKLLQDPQLRRRMPRVVWIIGAVLATGVAMVGWLPLPSTTFAEGVVWIGEDAQVRAKVNGFAREVLVRPGALVVTGQPLVRCEQPDLEAQVRIIEAQIAAAQAREEASVRTPAAQRVIAEELRYLRREHQQILQHRAELLIRSPSTGRLILPDADDLPGRYLTRGMHVGYVSQASDFNISVPVSQDDVDIVQKRTTQVTVRFASQPHKDYRAVLAQQVPAASRLLPSAILTTGGGGRIARDPSTPNKLQSFNPYFYFHLEIPDAPKHYLEERVYVRFTHPAEAIFPRAYRATRRLFLSHFRV